MRGNVVCPLAIAFSSRATPGPCGLHESSDDHMGVGRFFGRVEPIILFAVRLPDSVLAIITAKHIQGEVTFQPGHLGPIKLEELSMGLSRPTEQASSG